MKDQHNLEPLTLNNLQNSMFVLLPDLVSASLSIPQCGVVIINIYPVTKFYN